jgi:hypothetical protein
LSEVYAADAVLAAICHGGPGFLHATDAEGKPLLKGLRVTAVSDRQIRELGITQTPQHPETELRKAGALYEKRRGLLEVLANHTDRDRAEPECGSRGGAQDDGSAGGSMSR